MWNARSADGMQCCAHVFLMPYSAAGGVSLCGCHLVRFTAALASCSCYDRQCHSCCERACIRVTIFPYAACSISAAGGRRRQCPCLQGDAKHSLPGGRDSRCHVLGRQGEHLSPEHSPFKHGATAITLACAGLATCFLTLVCWVSVPAAVHAHQPASAWPGHLQH
jgi:hypothetical protein